MAAVVSGTWQFGYGDRFDQNALKRLPPGSVVVDQGAANKAAIDYLTGAGHAQGATVGFPDPQTVKVTVQFTQPMTVLGIGNITSLSISGSDNRSSRCRIR